MAKRKAKKKKKRCAWLLLNYNSNIKTLCLPSELLKESKEENAKTDCLATLSCPVCIHDWRLPSGDLTSHLPSCSAHTLSLLHWFFCLHKKSWNPLLSTGWLAWMSRQVPGVTSRIKTAWSNSSWTPTLGTCGSGAAEGLPEPKAGSWEQVRRSRAGSPCPSGAVEFQLVEDPFLLRLLITARKLVLSPFHCCSHCLFSLFSFNANFFLNAFLIYFYVFIV